MDGTWPLETKMEHGDQWTYLPSSRSLSFPWCRTDQRADTPISSETKKVIRSSGLSFWWSSRIEVTESQSGHHSSVFFFEQNSSVFFKERIGYHKKHLHCTWCLFQERRDILWYLLGGQSAYTHRLILASSVTLTVYIHDQKSWNVYIYFRRIYLKLCFAATVCIVLPFLKYVSQVWSSYRHIFN